MEVLIHMLVKLYIKNNNNNPFSKGSDVAFQMWLSGLSPSHTPFLALLLVLLKWFCLARMCPWTVIIYLACFEWGL